MNGSTASICCFKVSRTYLSLSFEPLLWTNSCFKHRQQLTEWPLFICCAAGEFISTCAHLESVFIWPAKLTRPCFPGLLAGNDTPSSIYAAAWRRCGDTQLSGRPQQHIVPHHLPFYFLRNMSESLWWLAVRMCSVFVLDLMPNLLSNNDCTGFVSEEKSGKKG